MQVQVGHQDLTRPPAHQPNSLSSSALNLDILCKLENLGELEDAPDPGVVAVQYQPGRPPPGPLHSPQQLSGEQKSEQWSQCSTNRLWLWLSTLSCFTRTRTSVVAGNGSPGCSLPSPALSSYSRVISRQPSPTTRSRYAAVQCRTVYV